MHEVSIMGEMFEIMEQAALEHQMKRISRVVLKIGEFSCVEEHALRFAFEALSKDGIVEGAQLNIERVDASARCPSCREVFKVTFTEKKCPICNEFSNDIVTGYEIELNQLEGE